MGNTKQADNVMLEGNQSAHVFGYFAASEKHSATTTGLAVCFLTRLSQLAAAQTSQVESHLPKTIGALTNKNHDNIHNTN